MFKFCPACGEELPQEQNILFCPFCGKKIGAATMEQDKRPVSVRTETLQREGQVYFEKTQTRIGQQVVSSTPVPADMDLEEEHYTVVLIDVVNRDRLVKRLSSIMQRTPLAIRMAVDMTPCIILYKGKQCDVQWLTDVLAEEGAKFSVVTGDAAPHTLLAAGMKVNSPTN